MTFALARSLLLADAVTPTALAEALFLSATRGTSLVRTLLAARAIDTLRLEQMLERGEAPYMRHIAPVMALVERLPRGLCDRLLAIPVRQDPRTGTVDVAVVDARDPHPPEEIAHWLKAPVRVVRTSIGSMESALIRIGERPPPEPDPGMRALAPPIWAPPPAPIPSKLLRTPMYGSRAYTAESAPVAAAPTPPAGGSRAPRAEEGDMAIPLTRRNSAMPVPLVEPEAPINLARPAEGRGGEPVLELRKRKGSSTPQLPDPGSSPSVPTERGPFPDSISGLSIAPAPPTPNVVRGEASSRVLEGPSPVLEQMREARDRDTILDLLVAGTRTIARRAAVLAVRKDGLSGWTASREIADRSVLRAVNLPNMMPTVFHAVLDTQTAHLVRVPMDAAHAPFIAVMRTPPSGPAVVAAVHAEGRPVAVVFVDGLVDQGAALERVGALAVAAGESFTRLLRERRSGKVR